MSELVIRPASQDDAHALAHLCTQLGYASEPAVIAARILERVDHKLCEVLVAVTADLVVGLVAVNIVQPLHENGNWATVSALVVEAGARSAGIGASLLSAAEVFAHEAGCTQIELSSSEARTQAHRFYQREGYLEKRKRFFKKL